MINKIAVFFIKQQFVQFTIQHQLKQIDYLKQNNFSDPLQDKIKLYLQGMVNQLYKLQFTNEKPIIIDFISSINPVTVNYAFDCCFSIKKLKQLQNVLLNNQFKIKIIVK